MQSLSPAAEEVISLALHEHTSAILQDALDIAERHHELEPSSFAVIWLLVSTHLKNSSESTTIIHQPVMRNITSINRPTNFKPSTINELQQARSAPHFQERHPGCVDRG